MGPESQPIKETFFQLLLGVADLVVLALEAGFSAFEWLLSWGE